MDISKSMDAIYVRLLKSMELQERMEMDLISQGCAISRLMADGACVRIDPVDVWVDGKEEK